MRQCLVFLACGLACVLAPAGSSAASFELLGEFSDPAYPTSHAYAVSADGDVVVGYGGRAIYNYAPFRWTSAEGLVDFAGVIRAGAGRAQDVSADGSVVVGGVWYDDGPGGAFRWTEQEGVVFLPKPPEWEHYATAATSVSADGSVIVGVAIEGEFSERLFRWTEPEGMVDLGPVHGSGDFRPRVSDDGSAIVAMYPLQGAFRWTEATGPVYLGIPPGAEGYPFACDISGDGSVIVGSVDYDGPSDSSPRAFRWTEQDGFDLLFGEPYYSGTSAAKAISADGSTIAGYFMGYEQTAFIWDAAHGPRSLSRVLLDEYGLNIHDYVVDLGWPNALSADGRVIVGTGKSEATRDYMAWRALIPEPSTTVLLLTGLLAGMLFARRNRNRIHV